MRNHCRITRANGTYLSQEIPREELVRAMFMRRGTAQFVRRETSVTLRFRDGAKGVRWSIWHFKQDTTALLPSVYSSHLISPFLTTNLQSFATSLS